MNPATPLLDRWRKQSLQIDAFVEAVAGNQPGVRGAVREAEVQVHENAAKRGCGRAGEDTGAAPVGSPVPAFSEKDVESGRAITSLSLNEGKTLPFFSEGVMCQACFEQIKGLEDVGAKLRRRDVRLVSVTPDSKDDLQSAIARYGITTPMIADSDRNMSAAFNTLGKGMHDDTPGHAFALMSHGKVLWYRDYWLPPDRSMYVEPEKILADMPA